VQEQVHHAQPHHAVHDVLLELPLFEVIFAVPLVHLLDEHFVQLAFVFQIAGTDCRNVVIVDAAALDREPGSVVFGPLSEFAEAGSVSTHRLALELSGKVLESAGKRIFLLGVVPEDLGLGHGLTPKVRESAARLGDLVLRAVEHAGEENTHES
jgi:hydrogenase maturation protease